MAQRAPKNGTRQHRKQARGKRADAADTGTRPADEPFALLAKYFGEWLAERDFADMIRNEKRTDDAPGQ